MKTGAKLFLYTFSAMLIGQLLTSCQGKSDKTDSELIVGEWNAEWSTQSEELANIPDQHRRMQGKIKFHEDGSVEIAAYGYDGCIFSSDTLTNQLSWKLEDSILRFIDQGDEEGLAYDVDAMAEQEMRLVLMEDIYLTLRR